MIVVLIAIQVVAGLVLFASIGLVWHASRRLDDEILELDAAITRLEQNG